MNKIKYPLFILLCVFCFGVVQSAEALTWRVGYHASPEEEVAQWIDAKVPGAVQLDYAAAHDWDLYWVGDHFKDYLWMEDVYWTYQTSFKKPDLEKDERLYFKSLGIDYRFIISINGKSIFEQEGMFTPVALDLTEFLESENLLEITIFPAPKLNHDKNDRRQADQSVKPAVAYGWDWHPRLIPLGIWDKTGLEILNIKTLTEFSVDYQLNTDLTEARVLLHIRPLQQTQISYIWTLYDPDGNRVFEEKGAVDTSLCVERKLSNIRLWWPHDHGKPDLYLSTCQLISKGIVIKEEQQKIGFRNVRLVMNEGAWNQPQGFPKTRSTPPFQLEVNGRRIFCKGSNWVPPEIFPGIITKERYEELLDLAVGINFNMLRQWGGGIVNKQSFYDLCDEKGLMVWQDFPLACNAYEGTPHYLDVLEQEATSIIQKLKQHPSVVLWCGGNELFNAWSRSSDQALSLRLLNSLCYQLDPGRPFIMTSPVMGVGHGHYLFRDDQSQEDVFQLMKRSDYTAYTEFGMPAPSDAAILKSFIPENELWPPRPGTVWETHHAFKAWQEDSWLCLPLLKRYFGVQKDLHTLVQNGQFLQSVGYQCIYESARRQKPYCSMALNWCYNEPWPTAANNSIIQWPAIPKPSYHAVKAACRPVLASAQIEKFVWTEGDVFQTHISMLNDCYAEFPKCRVNVKLIGSDAMDMGIVNYDELKPNTNQAGDILQCVLPTWETKTIELRLEVEGKPEWNSTYTLLYRLKNETGGDNN